MQPFLCKYFHVKIKENDAKDLDDQRILESDWTITFWLITCKQEFFQIGVFTGKQRVVMCMLVYFNLSQV